MIHQVLTKEKILEFLLIECPEAKNHPELIEKAYKILEAKHIITGFHKNWVYQTSSIPRNGKKQLNQFDIRNIVRGL